MMLLLIAATASPINSNNLPAAPVYIQQCSNDIAELRIKDKNRRFSSIRRKTIKNKIFGTLIIATKLIIGLNIITPIRYSNLTLYTNMEYAYNCNTGSI